MHQWITVLVLSGLCLSLLPDDASARERQRRLWFRNQSPIFLMPPPPPQRYQRFYLYGAPEQYDLYAEDNYEPPYQPEPRQKQKTKKTGVKKSGTDAKALAKPAPAKPAAISCDKGRAIVEDFGFQAVKPASCKGQIYAFLAMRDGKAYSVKLDSGNGELTEVKKQP